MMLCYHSNHIGHIHGDYNVLDDSAWESCNLDRGACIPNHPHVHGDRMIVFHNVYDCLAISKQKLTFTTTENKST